MILPKKKPKKTAENRVETKWEKFKRVLAETTGTFSGKGGDKSDRGAQFRNYLAMIDRLESKRISLRRGLVRDPGEKLVAQAGRLGGVKTTRMSTIMDKYHAKALRMAQAKYYQKQLG